MFHSRVESSTFPQVGTVTPMSKNKVQILNPLPLGLSSVSVKRAIRYIRCGMAIKVGSAIRFIQTHQTDSVQANHDLAYDQASNSGHCTIKMLKALPMAGNLNRAGWY